MLHDPAELAECETGAFVLGVRGLPGQLELTGRTPREGVELVHVRHRQFERGAVE
jgi:hypothetical protein